MLLCKCYYVFDHSGMNGEKGGGYSWMGGWVIFMEKCAKKKNVDIG